MYMKGMAKAKRPRTAAQIEAEKRREAVDQHGKTLVRHTKASAIALAKLRERFEDMSDPELLRLGVQELAAKRNKR